jgi:hypothetical protein
MYTSYSPRQLKKKIIISAGLFVTSLRTRKIISSGLPLRVRGVRCCLRRMSRLSYSAVIFDSSPHVSAKQAGKTSVKVVRL